MENNYFFSIAALALMAYAAPGAAATVTWTVTSAGSNGTCAIIPMKNTNCTLDVAIKKAMSGNIIKFSSEIQGKAINGNFIISNKSITIDGSPGGITLDGGGENTVLTITGDPSNRVVLNNLTIQNGKGENGGGIYDYYANLTINNSTISNNTATGNSTTGLGGGIFTDWGGITINNSTITNNIAIGPSSYSDSTGLLPGGGGIYLRNGMLWANNLICSDNTAIHGSGGCIFGDNSSVDIDNSTISHNTGTNLEDDAGHYLYSHGGGIGADDAIFMKISNSTFTANSAAIGGGAYGFFDIINTTFANNSASSRAGAIYGSSIISNSTITNNSAVNGGGIINSGTLNLMSTIIAGNRNTKVDSVYGPDIDSSGHTVVSKGHNLIGDGTNSSLTNGVNNDQVGPASTAVPGFVTDTSGLPLLTDNGGPTLTIALQSNSTAIGNGYCDGYIDSTVNIPSVTADQRGDDYLRQTPCTIGAYEYGAGQTD